MRRNGARANAFSPAEMAGFENRAVAAIAELGARQGRVRADLEARAGFRIVVEIAEGAPPLRAGRFDPINLLVLDGGEVVHPRSLTLSGPAGTVEVANSS